MEIKRFEPPSIEDIQQRFDEKGISALTDEDVATLLGTCEAYRDKLKAISEIAYNIVGENGLYLTARERLYQIQPIIEDF